MHAGNEMKTLNLMIFVTFLLTGCLAKMEKTTEDTRGEVRATREGQQLGLALEILHNDDLKDFAMRAAAAEGVFILAPEERIHKYLGARLPITIAGDPMTGHANVTVVYNEEPPVSGGAASAHSPINPGLWAPKSRSVFSIMEHAVLAVLEDLRIVTMKDLTSEKLAEYRSKYSRMILVATTIMGARLETNVSRYFRDEVPAVIHNTRGEEEKLSSLEFRTKTVRLLKANASKLALDDNELSVLRTLISTRLGLDYDRID
jgi:hypothetical protein